MKKILSLALAALLVLSVFAGCGDKKGTDSGSSSGASSKQGADVRIAGVKSPAGISLAKFMKDSGDKKTANQYTATLYGDAATAAEKLSAGEVDIAVLPTDVAAALYAQNSGSVQLLAANVLGALTVVDTTGEIKNLYGLMGQTVYAAGQGTTSEYLLNYVLDHSGLTVGTDVRIEYVDSYDQLVDMVADGRAPLAVMPEPYLSSALAKNGSAKAAVDLGGEWDRVSDGKELLLGAAVARTDFVKENGQAVKDFLQDFQNSVEFAAGNTEETAALAQKYDIMKAEIAERAIPNLGIAYRDGESMKASVSSLLQILFEANAQSVGGSLPGDDFYYAKA